MFACFCMEDETLDEVLPLHRRALASHRFVTYVMIIKLDCKGRW